MAVSLLDSAAVEVLLRQPFTYSEVGQTKMHSPPSGFHSFSHSRMLSAGTDFAAATRGLFGWQVQTRAGLMVAASGLTAEPDAVVVMRLGIGALALSIPCRVVYVIDETDRQGFAYGTLPGHPESGEESFVLYRDVQDRVRFVISAFSRPATRVAKIGGPASAYFQQLMTKRYLKALDR